MPENVNQPNFITFDIEGDLKALSNDGYESPILGAADRAAQALAIITRGTANAQSNHATLVALLKTAHDEAKTAHDDLMQKRMELEKGPQLDLIVEIGSRRLEIEAAQQRVLAALQALVDAQLSWRGSWPAQARKLGVLEEDLQLLLDVRKQQIDELDGPIRADREALTQMGKRAEVVDNYKYDIIIKGIEDRTLKIEKVNTAIAQTRERMLTQLGIIADEVKKTLAAPTANKWRVQRLEVKILDMMERLKTVHVLYGEIHSDLSEEQRQSLESEIASLSIAVGQAQDNVSDCVAAVESGRPVDPMKANFTLFPLTPLRRAPASEDAGTQPEIALSTKVRGWLNLLTGAKHQTGGSA